MNNTSVETSGSPAPNSHLMPWLSGIALAVPPVPFSSNYWLLWMHINPVQEPVMINVFWLFSRNEGSKVFLWVNNQYLRRFNSRGFMKP